MERAGSNGGRKPVLADDSFMEANGVTCKEPPGYFASVPNAEVQLNECTARKPPFKTLQNSA